MTSTTPDDQHAVATTSLGGGSEHNSPTKTRDIASTSSTVPIANLYYYDNVAVSLVPEKKGIFLKHSEYEVDNLKSMNHSSRF